MAEKPLVTLQKVTKYFTSRFYEQKVLEDVSLTFHAGMSYAIMGASGTGKSTLLHLIAGFETPTHGSILFEGRDIASYTPDELQNFRMHKIGLLFQQPYLLRELSVEENVMLPALIAGVSRRHARERAHSLLAALGVFETHHKEPAALSGGQQQRVALARALINDPLLLLADEPTGNLDEKTAQVILELLKKKQQELGISLILCTHDPLIAQSLERQLTLHEGMVHSMKNN